MRSSNSLPRERRRKKTSQHPANIEDFAKVYGYAHFKFEKGSPVEPRFEVRDIFLHPILQPLKPAARAVAAVSIAQANAWYRIRTQGRYWVLPSLGEEYPHPAGIRTGVYPSWKRQIDSLEATFDRLCANFCQAAQAEHHTIVGRSFEETPAGLLLAAQGLVRKAIRWMEAFPNPTQLRSKYREIVRPQVETESIGVVAYTLDRLFREHVAGPKLKIKEIECRIAEVEKEFLGQRVDYGSKRGCAAVRLQIRTWKGSKTRLAVDAQMKKRLRRFAATIRNIDPRRIAAANDRFWKKWEQHYKANDVWFDRMDSKHDADIRRFVEGAQHRGELAERLQETSGNAKRL